jgi:hypothetical protein
MHDLSQSPCPARPERFPGVHTVVLFLILGIEQSAECGVSRSDCRTATCGPTQSPWSGSRRVCSSRDSTPASSIGPVPNRLRGRALPRSVSFEVRHVPGCHGWNFGILSPLVSGTSIRCGLLDDFGEDCSRGQKAIGGSSRTQKSGTTAAILAATHHARSRERVMARFSLRVGDRAR